MSVKTILTSWFSGNDFSVDACIEFIKLVPWSPLFGGLKFCAKFY